MQLVPYRGKFSNRGFSCAASRHRGASENEWEVLQPQPSVRSSPRGSRSQRRRPLLCQDAYRSAYPAVVIEKIGAGEGNRTLVISLEGCCSTIELHPQKTWPVLAPPPAFACNGSAKPKRQRR